MEPTIRLAEPRDAEAIREIYNLEVRETTVTFDLVPRTLEAQREWLVEHSGGHPAIAAVDETGRLMGFGSLSPYKERPAYFPTVEDSIYVHRDHRGAGVGRLVLAELIRLARTYGYHSVVARIVGGHHTSIKLHAAHGFELVGVEQQVGRKLGRWLDVVLMQKML